MTPRDPDHQLGWDAEAGRPAGEPGVLERRRRAELEREHWAWGHSQVRTQTDCISVAFGTDIQQQEKELREGRGYAGASVSRRTSADHSGPARGLGEEVRDEGTGLRENGWAGLHML